MAGQNTASILLQAGREVPHQVIVHLVQNKTDDQAITYRELICGAAGVADALERAAIHPGEVIILLMSSERDMLFSFFGAVLYGAIPSIMPYLTEKLSPEHYRRSLSALFNTTQPAAVITYPDFVSEVDLAATNAPSIRAILVSDDLRASVSPEAGKLPGTRCTPDQIVLLQHSSGTTGLQKGVALSHQSLLNQLENYRRAIHLGPSDVIVSWLPLYHDMGLIAGFLLPILTRTPLALMSPFDWVRAPCKLMQAVTRYRGTLTWLPNFAYNFCAQKIRDKQLEGVDLSSWRAVINCSEPIHWQSHQLFLDRFKPYGFNAHALATSYAMAENVFAITQGGIDQPLCSETIDAPKFYADQIAQPISPGNTAIRMVSSGRAINQTKIRVLDSKAKPLPDRHLGEIAIQSDCLLTGYYNRPDLTEKAYLDGWYLTGDLGYLADGELYVTGRKKDLIIVGGKNIYPQDLERLAEEVPGVHPGRVVAFGVFNEITGTEDVVLLGEADTDDEVERLRIADQIRNQVTRSSDIALRYVEIVSHGWLLKTSSGKIARSANRDKYLLEIQLPNNEHQV
jgi:acyl-CoA synthetase (AMP-forming)/AMP-acid ligase II